MDILILAATGFAAIIAFGTAAAWLYDTLEARLAVGRDLRGRAGVTARRTVVRPPRRHRTPGRLEMAPRNVRSHV